MKLSERINALVQLGEHLKQKDDEYLQAIMHRSQYRNAWFTIENQEKAVEATAACMLSKDKLRQWLKNYQISDQDISPSVNVGLVMAGNIPLAGFHDLLCVFVAGHRAIIKLSEQDQYLLPYLVKLLSRFDARAASYFQIARQLKGCEAVIADGVRHSRRYFEAYFGKYPNIIRSNRKSVAVLQGDETPEELRELGKDVFLYFGLARRNVSKIYVPRDYTFKPLLEALHHYRNIVLHSKYKNNFDYNYALFVLNKVKYMANGCIILTENAAIRSPIANLHYEFYDNRESLLQKLKAQEEEIQCLFARDTSLPLPAFPFGKAQEPELWDYAERVDTMAFLLNL